MGHQNQSTVSLLRGEVKIVLTLLFSVAALCDDVKVVRVAALSFLEMRRDYGE